MITAISQSSYMFFSSTVSSDYPSVYSILDCTFSMEVKGDLNSDWVGASMVINTPN